MKHLPPLHDELSDLGEVQIWARQLAIRLVGDSHLAEDVVQDALVASLENSTAVQSPRAWLAGTIRNLSANVRRDRASRLRREEASSPKEALPSTAETAERLESQDILINALLAMDEPFRGALMARYVDGLAPKVIAARDRVPVATVNSRLARGLARMREALKHRHGGDETRWIAALVPLVPSIQLASGPAAAKASAAAGVLLMKKTLLVVALICLLVPLGWKLLSTPSDPSGPTQPIDVAAVDYVASVPEVLEVSGPVASSNEPEDKARRSPATMTASEASVLPNELDGAPLRTLLVLDAGSEQPVVGAKIRVMPSGMILREQRPGVAAFSAEDWPSSSRELARRRGRLFETDVNGSVRVPVPESGSVAAVQKGGLHGKAYLFQAQTETVVYLNADRVVEVRVVNGIGKALEGVPVRLEQELSDEDTTMMIPMARSMTRTGEEGTSALIALPGGEVGEMPSARWFIAVDAPLLAAERHEVFLEHWPSAPVTLKLLERGAVTVELKAASAPQRKTAAFKKAMDYLGDGAVVQLLPLGEPLVFGNSLWTERGSVLKEGRHRFTPVGAGIELLAALWPKGPGLPFNALGRGPSVVPLETTITLDPWDETNRVFGRVVDHEGNGIPRLEMAVAFLPGRWLPDGLVTDDEGHFEWRIQLDLPPYAGAEFQLNEAEAPHRLVSLPSERLAEAVRLARSAKAGVDLGDIMLPDPTPTVPHLTGKVVTPAGTGVPGAWVHWGKLDPEGAGFLRQARVHSDFTDASGHFDLAAVNAGPSAALWVELSGNHFHDPIPLNSLPRDESGNVIVEVQSGSVLIGSVLLDVGIPTSGIQIGAWPLASGPMPDDADVMGWLPGVLDAEGRFRLEGLRPGSYAVRAGIGEDHDDAAIVTAEAVAGESEVAPIDLRGLLALFDSRVVDERGRVLNATLSMISPKVQQGRETYGFPEWLGTLQRGRQVVYGTGPGAWIVVEAKGYFPTAVDPRNAPDEVVLKRGFDVELQIACDAELGDTPGKLKVQLIGIEVDADLPREVRRSIKHRSLSKANVNAAGVARIQVPSAGEYVVKVSIDYEARSGYHIERFLNLEAPMELTIGRVESRAVPYDIPIHSAAYQGALDYVRMTFDAWVADGMLPSDLVFGQTYAE